MSRSLIGKATAKIARDANNLFAKFHIVEEARYSERAEETLATHPPIFVIGAPRSGSTLLFKSMTQRFRVGYLTNYVARTPLTPAVALAKQTEQGLWEASDGYKFDYGNDEGPGAPSEMGALWYRWFQKSAQTGTLLPSASLEQMRKSIGGITAVAGAPLVIKNMFNSMRLPTLHQAFPEARYVVCRRERVDNALSILRGRVDKVGDKAKWWSTPIPEMDALAGLPYADQVARQVAAIERAISEARQIIGDDSFRVIQYEEFCADPLGILDRIGTDFKLEPRGFIPERFEASKPKADPGDRELVEEAFRQIG